MDTDLHPSWDVYFWHGFDVNEAESVRGQFFKTELINEDSKQMTGISVFEVRADVLMRVLQHQGYNVWFHKDGKNVYITKHSSFGQR